jgi:hypothetical protein
MSNSERPKKGRSEDLALNQPQLQPSGRTTETKPTSLHLRNLSHGGSERLRRIRFDQDPLDSSTDGGSTSGKFCHTTTTYSGSITSDQMSELQGGGHNQGDNASVFSYNSTRDITRFVREINGR